MWVEQTMLLLNMVIFRFRNFGNFEISKILFSKMKGFNPSENLRDGWHCVGMRHDPTPFAKTSPDEVQRLSRCWILYLLTTLRNNASLHQIMLVNNPSSEPSGTKFFGRAKPQPASMTLRDIFEKDILTNIRLRAVPRTWVMIYPSIIAMMDLWISL